MVSVLCTVYNHEKYIAHALESMLNQETDFAYEVIVHDDASTDRSADVIREIEKKYPEKLKVIYAPENRHSKHLPILQYMLELASGKYIALCEGDDYWTDVHKLQKQADAMEANPSCKMCVHKTIAVDVDENPIGVVYPAFPVKAGVLPSEEFLDHCKTYAFHTSSYFFDAREYRKYIFDPPEFKRICDVGDEVYMLYFGQLGDVYFIPDIMSAYRRGVDGSWSVRTAKNYDENQCRHALTMIRTIEEYDGFTNGKYHEFCLKKASHSVAVYCILAKKSKLCLKEYRKYFAYLPRSRKIFIVLGMFFPAAAKKLYLKRIEKLNTKNKVI